MDLDFTDHARRQMRDRQISEAAVYHVAGDADEVVERPDDCTEYTGTWAGRTLRIVLCGDTEPYRVRTVIELEKRRRRR